jgi:predicted DNA-binding transcriptional regulator YafY
MSKETYIIRYSLIIKRLERGPADFEELEQFLQNESNIQDKDLNISRRTLQRDIKDIYSQLNIEIENEKKGAFRYFIKSRPETLEHSNRLLESYQMMSTIEASRNFANLVFLETRQPQGLENFHGLLHAIQNKLVLSFEHVKFWEDMITQRKVHPLALKESQGRWYLIAVDTKDDKLKTFGLDRIKNIEISKSPFRAKYNFPLEEHFKNMFGISSDGLDKPEKVALQFDYEQGQYIKNFPLHSSQHVVSEEGDKVVVELLVYLSWDFIKELLSWGPEMTVIAPNSLRERMRTLLGQTLKQYDKKPQKGLK